MFLVQFKRLRRGVPEVIRTLHFPGSTAPPHWHAPRASPGRGTGRSGPMLCG